MLNEVYRDMLHALSDEKAKFLLVGTYALAAHGYPRATMDIVRQLNRVQYGLYLNHASKDKTTDPRFRKRRFYQSRW
jgi:hypothetical protein